MTLFRFRAMYFPGAGKPLKVRRAIGALALLFVFFLPLHFHFSITSQVVKDCSCLHGARTQLAPTSSSPSIVPQLPISLVSDSLVCGWIEHESAEHHVRG